MKLERLSPLNHHLFQEALDIYKVSFPYLERREENEQLRILKKDNYHFDLIMEDNTLIGLMLYWDLGSIIFLEHYAIVPSLRNKGYGTKAINLLKKKNKTIVLEIEPPLEEVSIKRYEFYKRNGFIMNPYDYIQPKYRLGDTDLELKILSYPSLLSKEDFRYFYEFTVREVGIEPSIASNNYQIRKLEDNDDYNQVAKLIYSSDKYIYPYWFTNIETGIKVIKEMINLNTIYNKDNILVAVAPNGDIAGAVISKPSPFKEDINEIYKAYELAKIEVDYRTKQIFNAYYAKMGLKEDGYYIANIAVDEAYRKQGIAASLLSSLIRSNDFCSLECVIANKGGWRLYQRLGFKIEYEYPGVFDIPCYKMVYKK